MIAIIDYGVGNLYSLKSSLDKLGIENKVTSDANEIINADKLTRDWTWVSCIARRLFTL